MDRRSFHHLLHQFSAITHINNSECFQLFAYETTYGTRIHDRSCTLLIYLFGNLMNWFWFPNLGLICVWIWIVPKLSGAQPILLVSTALFFTDDFEFCIFITSVLEGYEFFKYWLRVWWFLQNNRLLFQCNDCWKKKAIDKLICTSVNRFQNRLSNSLSAVSEIIPLWNRLTVALLIKLSNSWWERNALLSRSWNTQISSRKE